MIPVKQTQHDLTNGNCFAACVASILELAIEDVPNFCGDGYNEKTWFVEFIKWAEDRGLAVVYSAWPGDNLIINNSFAIACGLSQKGNPHAVIVQSRYIGTKDNGDGTQGFDYEIDLIWDPSGNRNSQAGLSKILMIAFIFPGVSKIVRLRNADIQNTPQETTGG